MSTNEFTTTAIWAAGVAVLTLVVAGWRKHARASIDPQRAHPGTLLRAGLPEGRARLEIYRPAPWWKRVWAALAGASLAVLLGAALATITGFVMASLVVRLSDMLKR